MFRTESVFFYQGYKCVVVFTKIGHRCGYVAVTPDHPLFGIAYSQDIKSPELLQEISNSTIGKKSLIDIFCWDGKEARLSLLVNVHGGITYSGLSHLSNFPTNQFDKVWYFGFDCGHYGDGKDLKTAVKYFGLNRMKWILDYEDKYGYADKDEVRSLSYVKNECKLLAEQLDCIKEILIQTRVKIN